MATTTTTPRKAYVGQRIRRTEDPRLITGTATYVDDIKREGMLYAAVLRSPHSAAKISSIAIEKAAALPGVRAVYTGEDIKEVGPVPCAGSMPTLRVPHHHILAQDRVYYVGHPVAAVVAMDRYVAQEPLKRMIEDTVDGTKNWGWQLWNLLLAPLSCSHLEMQDDAEATLITQ